LVHGAFAGASSWNGVIERLQAQGVPVIAVANPLRGIANDPAYAAAAFNQTRGPVLAVGHSYGGAVITNAATDADNVVGLVYVAAFAPDDGEALGEVEAGSKDSVLNSALVPQQYPTANAGTGGGVPDRCRQGPRCVRRRRPGRPGGPHRRHPAPGRRGGVLRAERAPAWKRLPSWAVVATGDKAAGTDVVRAQAQRASATITELEGSHVMMISQPQAVTDVILQALAATSKEATHVAAQH
jgi:pimeloyl-ACP methyl ester carboxylesterase